MIKAMMKAKKSNLLATNKKIIVIGCPGSGKSTFSKELNKITGIPLFHLDMMYWNSDKTIVENSVFLERLSKIFENEKWIIDGNYSKTLDLRIQNCDTVIFLDFPVEICLEGVRSRLGKKRTDMPWIEQNEDAEFIEFIKNFNTNNKPQILKLLNKYSNKEIYIFKSRNELNDFLLNLKGVNE